MRHTFHTSQWVSHPVKKVFDFFADPRNLPRLMPAWQKARIEDSHLVSPGPRSSSDQSSDQPVAGAGSKMTISFRPVPLLPLRMTWDAAIVEFAWDHHFCDEQPKGPFAYWRHCHRVRPEPQGSSSGTRVFDDLIYELPFGMLSEPVHAIFVRKQIESIFKYRQVTLLKLLSPA